MPINSHIPLPKAPHDYVDEHGCICGALYDDFRYFTGRRKVKTNGQVKIIDSNFAQGSDALRRAYGGYEAGGGYRSRRGVLYMMRVLKLQAWYEEHAGHTEPR